MIKPLFLAHGSPMMAIEKNNYTEFLNNLGGTLKPKAVVIFTAHWLSEVLTISYTNSVYETLYDFYGFPEELYKIKYKAKGSSSIATKVADKLTSQNIKVEKDVTRGLDHGAWTLLKNLFPNADVPIVQVSVNLNLPIKEQIKIGNALNTLAHEDILIIGSGNTVHNLREVNYDTNSPDSWAVEFDDWLIDKIAKKDFDSLNDYRNIAPNARLAVPTADHFVPLFITLGSSPELNSKIIFRDYQFGNLSYLCFEF